MCFGLSVGRGRPEAPPPNTHPDSAAVKEESVKNHRAPSSAGSEDRRRVESSRLAGERAIYEYAVNKDKSASAVLKWREVRGRAARMRLHSHGCCLTGTVVT
ncbi:unnamed protein product [Lota lota]